MSEADRDRIDEEIEALQKQQRELRDAIAAKRRERPPEPVRDYELLDAATGEPVRLSALMGDKPELVVIHNMGRKCPMCTLWADGFNGLRAHLENRLAFVVSSPDPPEVQREFARSRGWTMRMVSIAGSTFAEDLGFIWMHEGKSMLAPGFSVFRKGEDGVIVRVSKDMFGPGDEYCVMWSFFDALPSGQNEWWPKLEYPAE